ncbi:MAG: leucine--tRNA ligase [bacterium]|nr:leucine--tRNA ligase [bacterium]
MANYDPQKIESKWRKIWEKGKTFQVDLKKAKNPYYNLMMFPYPSAEGLHVGNVYAFTGSDIHGRFQKMQGKDVFEPMGFDAFGIHSENFAIKKGIHPKVLIKKNTDNFRGQLKFLGCLFDWRQVVDTTKPEYYKWTQWLFLQLFKAGLAYKKKAPVDWCPSCKTVLADEQVIQGKCERCDSEVIQKENEQWFFRITKYADRLLKNLETIDWSERTKLTQKNWIGKSEGALLKFPIAGSQLLIEVFTTRPDTLFGATYMVVAPEHEIIKSLGSKISNIEEVKKYIEGSKKKSELERTELVKEKTGVELKGVKAVNPANKEEVPIFVADYVLASYGTGAIMAVPAHDQRDFDFAKKYDLPIKTVICPNYPNPVCPVLDKAYVGDGRLVGSGEFNGMPWEKARWEITDFVGGKRTVNFHVRDWLISRQRYWGPPIPIVYCDSCKNKKYKYLLLHGRHGSSQGDFFPWLKKELEALGHKVYCPDLPDTENPKVGDQADFVIKNFKVDQDTVIIGHSLGGAVALNVLEKINKKVARVVFADSLIYPKFNDKRRPDLEKNFNWKFDFKKIKKLSHEFIDLADSNFPIIPKEQFEDKKRLLDTRLIFVEPQSDHFNSSVEPLILEYAKFDGVIPVPEKDLPVLLPYVKNFRPEGTGKSPLASVKNFVNTKCPKCKGKAKRETDVSDTFLDSAWYFLRYPSARVKNKPFEEALTKKWLPVDMYIGGQEHAVLHLLYSRFITMVLKDLGFIDFEEPFKKFRAHGLLKKEGVKMSKSKGNVVNPDEYYKEYGADTLRIYLMFSGPFQEGGDWQGNGIVGVKRFLERIWQLKEKIQTKSGVQDSKLEQILHKTIKKVTEDLEDLSYNTAISALMILSNQLAGSQETITKSAFENLLKLLAPFAPYITQELWSQLGNKNSIHSQPWPKYEAELLKEEKAILIIQVNGKVRDKIEVRSGVPEEEARQLTISRDNVKKWITGKEIKKIIFVQDKLINIVI